MGLIIPRGGLGEKFVTAKLKLTENSEGILSKQNPDLETAAVEAQQAGDPMSAPDAEGGKAAGYGGDGNVDADTP